MATRDYVVRMPRDVLVKAACQDVGCERWREGWESSFDESADCGHRGPLEECRWLPPAPCGACSAFHVRKFSRRTFTEHRTGTGLTVFRFGPHQRCFAEHRTRPARFLVADHGITEHAGMRDWVDDLGEHVTRIEDQRRKG